MKTNEAPEKIYVKITHPISDEYTEMIAFEDGDGIEYARTDAFIEKACDAYCRLCDTKECSDTGECIWVEKFRKHLMK